MIAKILYVVIVFSLCACAARRENNVNIGNLRNLLSKEIIIKEEILEHSVRNGGWQLSKVYAVEKVEKDNPACSLIWDASQKGNQIPMFTRHEDGVFYHYARLSLGLGNQGDVIAHSYGTYTFHSKTQMLQFYYSSLLGDFQRLRLLKIVELNDTMMLGQTEDVDSGIRLYIFRHLSKTRVGEWCKNNANRLLRNENLLTFDSFCTLFGSHRWAIKEYYNVYHGDSIGSEVLNDIVGASITDHLWLSDNMLHHQENNFSTHTKIPLKYDAQRHLLTLGDYVFIGHKLNNAYFKVLSLSNEEMRCLGPVMNPSWAENANAGLYIFR